MGHIKTNKALHLLRLSETTFDQQKTNVFFVFQKQLIRPRLSNLAATPSENHIVWAYLSCLRGKQIQQT